MVSNFIKTFSYELVGARYLSFRVALAIRCCCNYVAVRHHNNLAVCCCLWYFLIFLLPWFMTHYINRRRRLPKTYFSLPPLLLSAFLMCICVGSVALWLALIVFYLFASSEFGVPFAFYQLLLTKYASYNLIEFPKFSNFWQVNLWQLPLENVLAYRYLKCKIT